MSAKLRTFVAGGSGILAGELLRLLDAHPALEVEAAFSREAGRPLRELHPQLRSTLCTSALDEAPSRLARAAAASAQPLALFLSLPHGESAAAWKRVRAELGGAAERVRVVDLSADFRLRDAALHQRTYGEQHDPEGAAEFVYGLPELWRGRVREARRVAAAGCFATALQLASLPAAAGGLLDAARPWIFSGITGSSGAGATPKASTHHPFRHGNLFAYGVEGHRHEAELAQALLEHGLAPELCFLPHSGPFARGIHLTAALPLARELGSGEARALYARRFASEPFVEVLESGVPELRSVVGGNRASLALHVRGRTLIVLLTLDNMVKGGAGQALQCMNLMLGLPEASGLSAAGSGVA